MAEWKKSIARLGLDFCLSKRSILEVLHLVENKYNSTDIPSHYNGEREEYLYDKAHAMIMSRI